MPVTPSYPGLYIEELPSSTHTITPAPTSITVFVGYTHPFKTRPADAGKAIRLFSFNEYERTFGGFVASGVFDEQVAHAVNQFFLNGGSDAYVVGLRPRYRGAAGQILEPQQVLDPADSTQSFSDLTKVMNPLASFGNADQPGILFYGLEPTDSVPMRVQFTPKATPDGTADARADVTITYGTRAETFRDLTIADENDPTHIATRLNAASTLVRVRPNPPVNSFPPDFKESGLNGLSKDLEPSLPAPGTLGSTFGADDFAAVFQSNSDLDKVPVFNLMVLPGVADNSIWTASLAFCERKMAFLIMDPPRQANAFFTEDNTSTGPSFMEKAVPKSTNGAIYFPYLYSQHPLSGDRIELPPSGFVAGVYARTDAGRGVWKTPAGLEAFVRNTTGVVDRGRMNDPRQGVLNLKAVNCLRSFPGPGTVVVYGGRTLVGAKENTAFQQWRYVAVRRMALFIEQTLRDNLVWVVFEPNDEPLWAAIRATIENFLLSLFRQGALQGRTPSQAFQVKCDATTTTPDDVNNGIVNIVVAFAPLKPAEFVIIKIAQLAGQAQT